MLEQVLGPYEIVSRLGRGGMGEVYLARHTELNCYRALKFLPEGTHPDDRHVVRLLREAQAAASLNHASICTLHDIHHEGGHTFIVLDQ